MKSSNGQDTAYQPHQYLDDNIYTFAVPSLSVRGRILSLDKLLADILNKHAYPKEIKLLLSEVIVLTSLFGASLKFDGKFTLQIRSNGVVNLLICDFRTPNEMRAYARFDKERLAQAIENNETQSHQLLGEGNLVITLDQGPNTKPYQGVIALSGKKLEEVAQDYFNYSEQIPTYVRLATSVEEQSADEVKIRAGGIFLQYLPSNSTENTSFEDNKNLWQEASTLAKTVTDEELTDPAVSAGNLLYRLFHEQGVEIFTPPLSLKFKCSCSREYIESLLRNFSQEETEQAIEDDKISVTCDFCSETYVFDPKTLRKE